MNGWQMNFLFRMAYFQDYVRFRECKSINTLFLNKAKPVGNIYDLFHDKSPGPMKFGLHVNKKTP